MKAQAWSLANCEKDIGFLPNAEQLKVHASEELAHTLEVARQIDYLGDPTVRVKDAEYSRIRECSKLT